MKLPKLVWKFDPFNSGANSGGGTYRWYDYTWEEEIFQDDNSYVLAYSTADKDDEDGICSELGLTECSYKDYWRVLYGKYDGPEFIAKSEYPTYQKLRKKLELEVKVLGLERIAIRDARRYALPREKWKAAIEEA